MSQPNKPLFEDASASHELREFVAFARADGPSQADLQRLAARVEAAVGVAVAAPLLVKGGQVGSAPAGGNYGLSIAGKGTFANLLSSTSAKVMAVLGLSAGLWVGVWSQTRTFAPVSTQSPVVVSQAAPPHATAEAQRAPPEPTPLVEPLAPKAEEPAAEVVERPLAKPSASKPHVPRAAISEPVAAPSPPPSELGLIQEAQSLRTDSQRALTLLEEHARLYPHGALAQEREVLAVEVLLRAGQTEEGRTRAERFRRDHADSAHLPRLRALLERASRE